MDDPKTKELLRLMVTTDGGGDVIPSRFVCRWCYVTLGYHSTTYHTPFKMFPDPKHEPECFAVKHLGQEAR